MVDFCKGAGAGTPQCRALGLSGRRPADGEAAAAMPAEVTFG